MSSRTSATLQPPDPACSAWQSCSPRSTPGSPCCWPGLYSANGSAGSSGSASASPRSASFLSPHETLSSRHLQHPAACDGQGHRLAALHVGLPGLAGQVRLLVPGSDPALAGTPGLLAIGLQVGPLGGWEAA